MEPEETLPTLCADSEHFHFVFLTPLQPICPFLIIIFVLYFLLFSSKFLFFYRAAIKPPFFLCASTFFFFLLNIKVRLVQRRNPRISAQKASAVTTTAPTGRAWLAHFVWTAWEFRRFLCSSFLFVFLFYPSFLPRITRFRLFFFINFFRSLYLTCTSFFHSHPSPRLCAREEVLLPPCIIYL